MQVLAVIGVVLGLFSIGMAVAVIISYAKFLRSERVAFDLEVAQFWRDNL